MLGGIAQPAKNWIKHVMKRRKTKMKKKLSSGVAILLITVLAAACGGGGGGASSGNNTSTTAYTGSTSQAQISPSNAQTLTETGSNSVQLSSTAGGSSVGAPRLLRSIGLAARAAARVPETLSGNCGGTSVSDSTYNSATGAISGTTTHNNYCQDGTTENGQTSFSGTFNAATSALNITMTFTNYAVKDSTSDTIMNGTATLTGTLVNGTMNNFTMIMNVDTRDNIENMVLKMENVNISIIDTASYTEFTISSGKVYHPDYGYFELSTPTAIRTNVGDANPSSGVLIITGANNTKGKLTYLSNTQYTVEVDETGSGTFVVVDTAGATTSAAVKNELVSRSTDSTVTGTNTTSEWPAISADGRYVAFVSYAANLAPGATGLKRQIFVHDRQTHQTELVSVTTAGAEGNNDSFAPAISSDGRYVVFESYAVNLVPGDANLVRDVFIRDRQALTTSRISVGAGGVEGNSESFAPAVSADGRYVAFTSYADNLTPGVTGNAKTNVYVRDMLTATNTLVSMTLSLIGGSQSSSLPAISADGSRIAFWSFESNLVGGDTNGLWDIFLWDRNAATKITLVSVSSTGVQKNQGNESVSRIVAPAISANGDIIAYSTTATNLVPGDTNGLQDVFVHQVSTAVTIRASEGAGGVQATGDSPVGQGERVALSSDGTWVAFTTAAANISAGGNNVMIHNNFTSETIAITANVANFSGSKGPALSGDGRFVAFMSGAQLDPRFASSGVFVQDRTLP
jgi:hypothetical protein